MEEVDQKQHEYFMRLALQEAEKAQAIDEVPIGAVVVFKDRIIARTHNLTEQLTDFTAHAEMQAYTMATAALGNKYLNQCVLYVTMEPCVMCAGASLWTRIGTIVYGAGDERRGFRRINQDIIHPKTQVISGVLEEECSQIVKQFFIRKR